MPTSKQRSILLTFVAISLVTTFALLRKPEPIRNERPEVTVGTVVAVHDGDTLTILTPEKEQIKVRLEGIDAPELKQPFGNASKQSLSDLVFGRLVTLNATGKDRYRRTLGDIFVEGTWVNHSQVERGFAWHYLKYSKDSRLKKAETKAREAGLGLWRESNAVPPWLWRESKRAKNSQ